MTDVHWIVLGVIGAVVLGVIAYYVARFLKGSMKITLEQRSFRPGETISGLLTIHARRAIPAERIYVAVIGEEEERTRSSRSGSSSKRWRECYRDEVDVLLDEELEPYSRNRYTFTIAAPSEGSIATIAEALSAATEGVQDVAGQRMVKGLGSLMVGMSRMFAGRKRWKVTARVETRGVDLATKQKIHISPK